MSSPPFSPPRTPRRRPPRRGRASRLLYIALAVIVVGSFALGRALFALHSRGGPSQTAFSGESETFSEPTGTGAARAPSAGQAGIPTAASIHLGASRSRLGLPLGKPPLTLTPAPADQALAVSFHRPPRAGLVFDLDSGRVLWQHDATRVLPIASLAKMMTALLVARSLPADARVSISRRAVDAAGSKVGLLPLHKRVPLSALLYGLLLPSGNDAAIALAEASAGSVERFVQRMNRQAAELGLGCTRLTSPDGLDDGNSSCAVDLAELAYADLAQPRLVPIVRLASAIVPFPIKGGKLYLYNNNPLLRYRYPGASGLKTGETEAAGLCLVGTAERAHVRLGVVLLHSPELGRQAELLLNRAFERVYHQRHIADPPVPAGR